MPPVSVSTQYTHFQKPFSSQKSSPTSSQKFPGHNKLKSALFAYSPLTLASSCLVYGCAVVNQAHHSLVTGECNQQILNFAGEKQTNIAVFRFLKLKITESKLALTAGLVVLIGFCSLGPRDSDTIRQFCIGTQKLCFLYTKFAKN